MVKNNSVFMWMFVAVLSTLVQVAFAVLDSRSTITRTSVEFSKAYFFLDTDMCDYLSSEISGKNCEDVVDDYLCRVTSHASELGFKTNIMRRSLSDVETEIITQNSEFARVRIKALSRTHINSLFVWVDRLFHIGSVVHIDEMLDLVKKNNVWKVCGTTFALS